MSKSRISSNEALEAALGSLPGSARALMAQMEADPRIKVTRAPRQEAGKVAFDVDLRGSVPARNGYSGKEPLSETFGLIIKEDLRDIFGTGIAIKKTPASDFRAVADRNSPAHAFFEEIMAHQVTVPNR